MAGLCCLLACQVRPIGGLSSASSLCHFPLPSLLVPALLLPFLCLLTQSLSAVVKVLVLLSPLLHLPHAGLWVCKVTRELTVMW